MPVERKVDTGIEKQPAELLYLCSGPGSVSDPVVNDTLSPPL